MLSGSKLKELRLDRKMSVSDMAGQIVRGGLDKEAAASAIKNWERGLYRPIPRTEDVEKLASALGVKACDVSEWRTVYKYAPVSARKVRLVSDLISGKPVQDALDILKFTRKRSAPIMDKLLRSAIANADEHEADVDRLVVNVARADGAGVRVGTKRFRAKDRGRAHSIRQEASHIHISVSEA
jgi:large subunit ribosomal protein L22